MARAYSLDLRERVVGAGVEGQSCRSVARTSMVSVASVVKWSQRQRVVGSRAALKWAATGPTRGAREGLGSGADRREAGSHAASSAYGLADRGLVVSCYALWHFLQHEGVTFKKALRSGTGPPGRRQAA